MSGVAETLWALRLGEDTLARELMAMVERHPAEHEVVHVGRDLARWSQENAEAVADASGRYGVTGRGERHDVSAGSLRDLSDITAPAGSDEGALLLQGLGHLHLRASENSLYWEMLAQAAQALRDGALLDLASACHSRSLRQMRWTNTMIKNLSPQLLTVAAETA
ncbi:MULTISPECIES: hypothetical protein [unclassified Streptomyces]|uniref:hypothetical protein n=1 Tax=unclassified Streptomyces TaxID=2593676 RepID=UPI0033276F37